MRSHTSSYDTGNSPRSRALVLVAIGRSVNGTRSKAAEDEALQLIPCGWGEWPLRGVVAVAVVAVEVGVEGDGDKFLEARVIVGVVGGGRRDRVAGARRLAMRLQRDTSFG